MNIIEFIEHPDFLADQSLSTAQKMALKSVYGLRLSSEELKAFKDTTGLQVYPGIEQEEASYILGRRAGKSDKLASNIALYEACARSHKLSTGQKGVVMIVAPETKRQAGIVFDLIRDKLEASPVLCKMIEGITKTCITLNNGTEVQIYPCSIGKVRGESLICFIGDECAHWKVKGVDVDIDVLDSVRPGLDFPHSKMIKISTPWMMKGEIFQDYKQYWGKPESDVLVFRGSTKLFRPQYSDRKLARAKKRSPVAYRTEYLAFFREDLSTMFDPFIVDKAINYDRPLELPYTEGVSYVCFVDVAGGGGSDAYALAIAHLEAEKVIIDVVRSRPPKFNPDAVTAQYCELLKAYKIREVQGDKYSGDWASNCFQKHGIYFQKSEKTKSELYLEGESVFNTDRLSLPNREKLIVEFKNLIRKTRSGGRDAVDVSGSEHDDEANCVVGCSMLLVTGDYRLDESKGLSESAESEKQKMDKAASDWLLNKSPKKKKKDTPDELDMEKLEAEMLEDLDAKGDKKKKIVARISK